MDESSVRRLITATCAALYELRDEGLGPMMPASTLYVALGMDIHAYEVVARIMRDSGLVTTTSETITLTWKGLDLGRKICECLEAEGTK